MTDLAIPSTVPIAVDFAAAVAPANAHATALVKQAAQRKAAERKQGGVKDLAEGRQDQFRLNPFLIVVKPGFNARDFFDPANQQHVDEIARSIASRGFLRDKPITVVWEGDQPVVTDGECRLRATLRAINVYGAEIKSIPVVTEEKGASEAERVADQVVRNSGKPFTPLEMARNFMRLKGFGWSEQEIAARVGLTTTRVTQIIDLNALPEAVKAEIKAGNISSTFARDIMRDTKGDGVKATEKVREAVTNARARGKGKATAKDAGLTTGSLKQQARAIFTKASVTEPGRNNGKAVIEIDAADFAALRDMFGF